MRHTTHRMCSSNSQSTLGYWQLSFGGSEVRHRFSNVWGQLLNPHVQATYHPNQTWHLQPKFLFSNLERLQLVNHFQALPVFLTARPVQRAGLHTGLYSALSRDFNIFIFCSVFVPRSSNRRISKKLYGDLTYS